MSTYFGTVQKLQKAINMTFNYKLLLARQEWYSEDQQRPVTVFVVRRSVYDAEKDRHTAIELFKSTSQIQVLLFLRDLWYKLNGWKVPTDNERWEQIKLQKGISIGDEDGRGKE